MDTTTPTITPDHSARKHAKVSPSKLNYVDPSLGGCRGFKSSDETNAAAEEGTELHELLDKLLVEYRDGGMRGSWEGYLFSRRPALKWSDDHDYLLRFCARSVDMYFASRPRVVNEQRVTISDAGGTPITYGHYDVLIIPKPNVGILGDWKFGINPVEPAPTNRQGLAYAVGVFQAFPEIDVVGVKFVQPRLNWITEAVFHRRDIAKHIEVIKDLVHQSLTTNEALDKDPSSVPATQLNPGSACAHCVRCAKCPAYLQKMQVLAPAFGGMPAPVGVNLDAIDSPQKAALAYAWAKFLDDKLDDVKKRCLEVAELNGGKISITNPETGEELNYTVCERGFDRSLGSAPLVADSLAQWVTPEQVLGAADLALGRLQNLVVPAMMEQNDELSKKAAEEALATHLESHGLLSRPDGKIKYLKQTKKPKTKLIK